MTVSTLNPYKKQSTDFLGVSADKSQAIKSRQNEAQKINAQAQQKENLISSDEKSFFVRLFPESAEKISKHTLFNSAGKSISSNVQKGMLIDARV